MINVAISSETANRAAEALVAMQAAIPQILARVVNRTVEGMRTDAVKETSKLYYLTAKEVRDSITVKKASAGNLSGEIVSRGKRHSLADYQIAPKTPRAGKQTTLKGAVKREGGLKPLGPAFLVKRAGGKYFPFIRVGAAGGNRYRNIRSLISPSIPQTIKNKQIVQAMEEGAAERFIKRAEHEISRVKL